MAVLADLAEVVVADVEAHPLEKGALQLLVPFSKDDGHWPLLVEAQHHECEFLMCFAFQAANNDLSIISRYAEIGFALPMQTGENLVFVLTVRTAVGFSG